ncbi:hypothetical protein MMC16_002430 [Acarospora aff. strigata]|nr:hypothetical protein [Acarospora aff. strigata]
MNPPFPDHSAFASQLDEIDRLLQAFFVLKQGILLSVPADEDRDENLIGTEEESSRGWSSSTDSKSAVLVGPKATSLSFPSPSGTRSQPHPSGKPATVQIEHVMQASGSTNLGSNLQFGPGASTLGGWMLRHEPHSVAQSLNQERHADSGSLSQYNPSHGCDSDSPVTQVEHNSNGPNSSSSAQGPSGLPSTAMSSSGVKYAISQKELLPFAVDIIGSSSNTPSGIEKALASSRSIGTKHVRFAEKARVDAVADDFERAPEAI